MPIRFLCPACAATLSIGNHKAKTVVRCPKCNSRVRVPEQPEEPVLDGIPASTGIAVPPPVRVGPAAPPRQSDSVPVPVPPGPATAPSAAMEPEAPADPAPGPAVAGGAGGVPPDLPAPPRPYYPPPKPAVSPGMIAGGVAGALALLVVVVVVIAAASGGDEDERPVGAGGAQVRRIADRDDIGRAGRSDSPGFFQTLMGVVLAPPCLIICGLFYLLPTAIAFLRKHPNAPAITAVNLLVGWSGLGWVAALVWSLTATQRDVVHVHIHEH